MSIRFRSHVSIDEGARAQLVEDLHLERSEGVYARRPADASRVEGRSEAHEVTT